MVICPSGLKNAQLTSAGEPLQGSGPIEQDLIHGHLQLGHSLGLQQGAGFKFFRPSASLSWKIKKTRGSLSACGRAPSPTGADEKDQHKRSAVHSSASAEDGSRGQVLP